MDIIKLLAHRTARSKRALFIETIRHGWNNYSFIFYIGGVSAILGGMFGGVGWLSIIVTVTFFYYAGRFRRELELERERLKKKHKKLLV